MCGVRLTRVAFLLCDSIQANLLVDFHFSSSIFYFSAQDFRIVDILRQLLYGAGGFSYKSRWTLLTCTFIIRNATVLQKFSREE